MKFSDKIFLPPIRLSLIHILRRQPPQRWGLKASLFEMCIRDRIEYRLDKQNIIHVPVGKASFGAEKLYANLDTVMEAIAKAKPCLLYTSTPPGAAG